MSSGPKSVADDEFILEYYRARARQSTKQAPLSESVDASQSEVAADVVPDPDEAVPRDILTYLTLVGPKTTEEVREALQIEPVVFDSALKNLIGLDLVQIRDGATEPSLTLTDRGRRFAAMS